jgi:hypothetical protein
MEKILGTCETENIKYDFSFYKTIFVFLSDFLTFQTILKCLYNFELTLKSLKNSKLFHDFFYEF